MTAHGDQSFDKNIHNCHRVDTMPLELRSARTRGSGLPDLPSGRRLRLGGPWWALVGLGGVEEN